MYWCRTRIRNDYREGVNQLKLYFLGSLGLFVACILGCTKKNTEWTSDWLLPLAKDTLNLSNYHNDSTLNNSATNYVVDFKRTILDARLIDYLSLPDTTISQSFSPTIGIGNIPPGFTFYNSIETHELSIPNVQLKKAIVYAGAIRIKVFNPIATSAYYTISMPGVTLDGVDFEETFYVNAGTDEEPSVGEALITLDGYVLDLQGTDVMGASNISAYNILQTSLAIMSDPEGESASITTSDIFEFEAEFEQLKISYAQGYFGAQSFTDTVEVDIPYLDKIIEGSVSLNEIPLSVSIENGTKIPASFELTLVENTNTANNTVQLESSVLNSNHFIAPATGAWSTLQPSIYQIIMDANNSTLSNYIENLGYRHRFGYELRINPFDVQTGSFNEVFPSSRIKLTAETTFPLAIGIDGLSICDTIDFNLSAIDLNKVVSAESIELHVNTENSFPISGGVLCVFLDESMNALDSVFAENMFLSSLSGVLDQSDGLYKCTNKAVLLLDNQIISNIGAYKYVILQAHFDSGDTSTASPVSIPSNAYLYFDTFLKLTAKTSIQ